MSAAFEAAAPAALGLAGALLAFGFGAALVFTRAFFQAALLTALLGAACAFAAAGFNASTLAFALAAVGVGAAPAILLAAVHLTGTVASRRVGRPVLGAPLGAAALGVIAIFAMRDLPSSPLAPGESMPHTIIALALLAGGFTAFGLLGMDERGGGAKP